MSNYSNALLNNICHAVCVSQITVGTNIGQDYFFIALSDDIFPNKDNKSPIYQESLSINDLDLFKKSKAKYHKIIHNENGRVFELLSNSFKDYKESKGIYNEKH